MLLVFGLTTKSRLLGTRFSGCRRCGNHSNHDIVESSQRFSLFFVPLFRVGRAQYLDVCGVCGLATPLSEAEARSAGLERVAPTPQDAPTWGPQDR